jgi:hypothetical protein
MNQAQLIHAAKQREPAAIATLLNQSLLTRKIEVIETSLIENSLTLKVQSKKIPNQHKLLPFLSAEIKSLGIEALEQVIVYGMTEESDTAAWQESLTLSQDNLIVNHVTKLNSLPTITEEISENNREDAAETPEASDADIPAESIINEETPEEENEEPNAESESTFASRYAIPTTVTTANNNNASFPLVTIVASLAIGFGWGVMVGIYFGYQKAASEMPAQPGAIEQPQ